MNNHQIIKTILFIFFFSKQTVTLQQTLLILSLFIIKFRPWQYIFKCPAWCVNTRSINTRVSSSSTFVGLDHFSHWISSLFSQHTNTTLVGRHQVQHEVLKNTSLQHVPSDHGLFICAHICTASRRKLPSTKLHRLARQSSNKHKFVLLVLLKSHKCFGDALGILVQRVDAPGSLHRFQVSCFLEEFHQHILVDVLKDVRRRFLAVRRVEFDAAHCGTDATRV